MESHITQAEQNLQLLQAMIPANEQFYVFRTLYLGNRKWVEGDKQIEVGDQVVVCARLTKYKDKDGNIIPETFNGKIDGESVTPYLYSLNGQRE